MGFPSLEKRDEGRFLMPEQIVLPEESHLASSSRGEEIPPIPEVLTLGRLAQDDRGGWAFPLWKRGMKGDS
jgi:hypothetical protein